MTINLSVEVSCGHVHNNQPCSRCLACFVKHLWQRISNWVRYLHVCIVNTYNIDVISVNVTFDSSSDARSNI